MSIVDTIATSIMMVVVLVPLINGIIYVYLSSNNKHFLVCKLVSLRVLVLMLIYLYKCISWVRESNIFNVIRLHITLNTREVVIKGSNGHYAMAVYNGFFKLRQVYLCNIHITLFHSRISAYGISGVFDSEIKGLEWVLNAFLLKRKFLI